jgi:class 3 adenylate cyclase
MGSQLGSGNRIGTVLFVDIVRYSEESVSRQVEVKAWFSAILSAALEHSAAADRLMLDTGDGAALCFLGDPEDALFAANALRSRVLESSVPTVQLRLGINLGPVRVVKDINGHSNVIGDGINVAQRVMSFAAPNQILVSRSYYEVVSRLAPDYARLFQYVGLHRDKHVREHEVYEVQLAAPSADPAAGSLDTAPGAPPEATAQPPAAAAEASTRFDPAFVERLTTALTREIGPVAKLVVRRAAERAADEGALRDAVTAQVPESNRAAFVAGLGDFPRPAAAGQPAEPLAPRSRPRGEINPDVLARAERRLADRIGPVAAILVRQAAKHAANGRELVEALAVHIDDPQARKAFVAEIDQLA